MPLQTSMNLVTITLAVRVCPGCEPIDQMVLKTTQQKGKNREEREERRNWMLAICYKCFILNFALDAPSPSSPSWFDEANYVHKTMSMLLINILQTLTFGPKCRQRKAKAEKQGVSALPIGFPDCVVCLDILLNK